MDKFFEDAEESKDSAIAELEKRLEKEKDMRLEERFCFILVGILIVDIIIFPNFQSWAAPLVIAFFELILLVLLAKRMRVDEASILLDKLLETYGKRKSR